MNFYYFSRLLEVLLICAIKRSLFLDFVYLLEYSECLANKSYLKHCEHYALLNEVFFIVLFFKGILDLNSLLLCRRCVVGFRYRGGGCFCAFETTIPANAVFMVLWDSFTLWNYDETIETKFLLFACISCFDNSFTLWNYYF